MGIGFGSQILDDRGCLKLKQRVVQQMLTERSKYEQTWLDLSRYICPLRGRVLEDRRDDEGKRRDKYLLDPYPMDALNKCAAGLHSGLTSPSRPWFALSLAD